MTAHDPTRDPLRQAFNEALEEIENELAEIASRLDTPRPQSEKLADLARISEIGDAFDRIEGWWHSEPPPERLL
jgi:hypothetical protein